MIKAFLPILFLSICFLACDRVDPLLLASEEIYYISIIQTVPAQNSINIPLDTKIAAYFDDTVNASTLSSTSFYISGDLTPAGYIFNENTKMAGMQLPSLLVPDTDYTVTCTTGIMNLVGETLQFDYSWTFRTASAAEPEIEIFQGALPVLVGDLLDFGVFLHGGTSISVPFTIENHGTADLLISGFTVGGLAPGGFSIDTTGTAMTVSQGGYTNFNVVFDPATAGNFEAVVTIDNNDQNEGIYSFMITANVSGTADPEIRVFSPSSELRCNSSLYKFGTVPIGSTSYTATITIVNSGTGVLNIDTPVLGGISPDAFVIDSSEMCTSINPCGETSFYLNFIPPEKNIFRATISIPNNDSDENPFVFTVNGRGK